MQRQMRTAVGMLEEGDAERHEDEAGDGEVGRRAAVDAMQRRHQQLVRPDLVAQLPDLSIAQHPQPQMVSCQAARDIDQAAVNMVLTRPAIAAQLNKRCAAWIAPMSG
jgi:hypothetical protein